MNTKIKNIATTTLTVLLAVLITTTVVKAVGSLTPSGTAGDDTQYTLNDIYDKLTDFTDSPTATSSPFTTPGTVSATFATLSDIYGLLQAEESDLVAGNIAYGIEIFGVEGTLSTTTPELDWSEIQNGNNMDNYENAVLACSGTIEGSTGWRLPTISELVSALINQYVLNISSENIFEADVENYYWSSTEEILTGEHYAAGTPDGSITLSIESQAYIICVK